MMLNIMQEKRPLKRPRLGPPDVYPQEAKQKEDELTLTNVKHGFATMPQLSEEFGTARNCNVTASKVGAYFNAILAKKEELMTLSDSGRKKQQINPKDNFWPVTARTKATLDTWFKDLAGTKPLLSLAKKAPSFNKKEEIFAMLCENQVSMQRAAWFIKLSSAYTVAVSEAKIKKRQMPDPATEWTGTLIKFLRDLIPRLTEHYYQGPNPPEKSSSSQSTLSSSNFSTSIQPSTTVSASNTVAPPLVSPASSMPSPANINLSQTSLTVQPTNPIDDQKLAIKQWNYTTQLSKYMYEEGLLDRQEILNWILELLEKMRSQPADDGMLKLFIPLALQYMTDIVQSERLCRRLAYQVAKKMLHMLNTAVDLSTINHQSGNGVGHVDNIKLETYDVENQNSNGAGDKIETVVEKEKKNNGVTVSFESYLNEYVNCPHHRDLILQLTAILQIVTIECPTALVWCGLGENRTSALSGSPIDHLPIAPSALPMPKRCMSTNAELRRQLKAIEESIKLRSRHAEARWCAEKWQNFGGNSYTRILATLDALDSHCFDRMETNYPLELLYTKIFPPPVSSQKDGGGSSSSASSSGGGNNSGGGGGGSGNSNSASNTGGESRETKNEYVS